MKVRKKEIRKALSLAVVLGLMGSVSCVSAAPEIAAVDQVAANPNMPNAGQTLSDLQQKGLPPAGVKVDGDIQVSEAERPALNLPNELKVQVNDFKITGQDIVPEATLKAMIAEKKGQLLTFGELQQIADKLTNYFKSQGYMVARVIIPVQKITNGVVEYSVVIGKFDGIKIENHTKIHDSALQREIAFLQKGNYIKKDKVERAVWLLSDLAGADAKVTIAPGTEQGSSNLTVVLNPHVGKQGTFYVDNYGSRSTGYYEFGLSYDFLNLAREGDHLAVNTLTTGRNLVNGSLNYTIPVWKDGLRMNAGLSALHYDLGDSYDVLDAFGRAMVYHLGWDYAIQRSQRHNLYTGIRFEHSDLRDEYGIYNLNYQKSSNSAVLSLYGDEMDAKGAAMWRFDYKLGSLSYGNDRTSSAFGPSGAEGGFSKINASILRRQNLNNRLYVLLSARGQYSSKNLDSYERMSLGGPNGVRAYPTSEASGDIGYLTRAELRWLLPLKKQDQTLQLATYIDHGGVRINKNNYTNSANYRKLQSVGLGILWSRKDDWWLRADYAWRLGAETPQSDRTYSNGHFWIQGGVYF